VEFELTTRTLRSCCEICRKLDGILWRSNWAAALVRDFGGAGARDTSRRPFSLADQRPQWVFRRASDADSGPRLELTTFSSEAERAVPCRRLGGSFGPASPSRCNLRIVVRSWPSQGTVHRRCRGMGRKITRCRGNDRTRARACGSRTTHPRRCALKATPKRRVGSCRAPPAYTTVIFSAR